MNSVTITAKERGCSSPNRPLAGSLGTRPAASSPPRGKPRSRHCEVYPLGSAPGYVRFTSGIPSGGARPHPAPVPERQGPGRPQRALDGSGPDCTALSSGNSLARRRAAAARAQAPTPPPNPPAGGGRAEPSPAAPRRAAREARGWPLPPGTAGEGRWSYPAGRARGGERGSGSAGGSVASPCSVTLRPWARGGKEGRSSPLATLPARNGGVRALRALSPSAEE